MKRVVFFFLYAAISITSRALVVDAAERAPNIVLIFCDDLGYGDLGCFGSKKHRTPNIDRMAREGTKLTSFYSTSGVCTPSRSSLMTGCYPRRVNMHEDARGGWVLFPRARKGLNPNEITMAEVLKSQGYATACVGKWHLGDQDPFLPRKQGFDTYYGIPYSNDMGTKQRRPQPNPPLPLLDGEKVIEAPVDQRTITKRYTDRVIDFMTKSRDKPFFVYLPHTFPHWPFFASERFHGKSANDGFGDTVEELDWSTGEILAAIKKLGIDENTLVIFTSDNGANPNRGGSNLPLRGRKGTTLEGGQRVPFIVRWPGKVPAGKECDELAVTFDLLPTFAKLAGGEAPKDRKIDGKDIRPLLLGTEGAKTPHEAFFYYFRDRLQAVRSGKWKLHVEGETPGRGRLPKGAKPPARLFDLSGDIREEKDVAGAHPDVVKKLETFAAAARADLGHGKQKGSGQRPAALVDEAKPLVKDPEPKPVFKTKADLDTMEAAFRESCRECTVHINGYYDVSGLHQKFPERVQELIDNEGDRLPH